MYSKTKLVLQAESSWLNVKVFPSFGGLEFDISVIDMSDLHYLK